MSGSEPAIRLEDGGAGGSEVSNQKVGAYPLLAPVSEPKGTDGGECPVCGGTTDEDRVVGCVGCWADAESVEEPSSEAQSLALEGAPRSSGESVIGGKNFPPGLNGPSSVTVSAGEVGTGTEEEWLDPEEETAVEHYVTWAQARKELGAAKLARKFPKGIPTPKALASRIRCWN